MTCGPKNVDEGKQGDIIDVDVQPDGPAIKDEAPGADAYGLDTGDADPELAVDVHLGLGLLVHVASLMVSLYLSNPGSHGTSAHGCQPLVSLSRSSHPLGTPVTCTLRSNSFWMLSNVGLSSSRMFVKPARMRWN